MKKVEKRVEEKFKWYNEKLQEHGKCPLYNTPSILPAEVLNERKVGYPCILLLLAFAF